jgi:hypothetical protein
MTDPVKDMLMKLEAAPKGDVVATVSYRIEQEGNGYVLRRHFDVSMFERLGEYASAAEALASVPETIGALTVDVGGIVFPS